MTRHEADYERIRKVMTPRKTKPEIQGRKNRKALEIKPSKKIDEENPRLSNRQLQTTFRTPLTPGTTTSPFVVGSARLPPEGIHRAHHLAHVVAIDQASGFLR
jgi:hypothetical protein